MADEAHGAAPSDNKVPDANEVKPPDQLSVSKSSVNEIDWHDRYQREHTKAIVAMVVAGMLLLFVVFFVAYSISSRAIERHETTRGGMMQRPDLWRY